MKFLNSSKKKYVVAVILALYIAFTAFNLAASAEDDSPPTYKEITESSEIIPVHGYIGPSSTVIPTEPLEIYVEVPVKILFAAFDTDEGIVTSPLYKITNLSDKNDIKVEIEDFTQIDAHDADLNDSLSLKLISPGNGDLVDELFPSDYSAPKLMTASLSKYIEESTNNVLQFTIAGTWNGTFDREIQPIFDMTVKFSGVE